MPRPRKHPLTHAENPNGIPSVAPVDSAAEPAGRLESYAVGTAREFDTRTALLSLCTRGDGWLRIVPQDDGNVIYAKYKFTSARYPNHYVMYREEGLDFCTMFWGLLRKVEAVDAGLLKPTYDTPYNVM